MTSGQLRFAFDFTSLAPVPLAPDGAGGTGYRSKWEAEGSPEGGGEAARFYLRERLGVGRQLLSQH